MIIDLPLMEKNIARLIECLRLQRKEIQIWPHLKTVKSPELAQKLLTAGAIGGCVAKVNEAEGHGSGRN